jgi:hypothetical protein
LIWTLTTEHAETYVVLNPMCDTFSNFLRQDTVWFNWHPKSIVRIVITVVTHSIKRQLHVLVASVTISAGIVPTRISLSTVVILMENACPYFVLCVSVSGRLCGLVIRVSDYRSRGPVSIPGATRFSEKLCVWNGVHSASRVQYKSYLKEKVVARA